jgi:hypothetical protein
MDVPAGDSYMPAVMDFFFDLYRLIYTLSFRFQSLWDILELSAFHIAFFFSQPVRTTQLPNPIVYH